MTHTTYAEMTDFQVEVDGHANGFPALEIHARVMVPGQITRIDLKSLKQAILKNIEFQSVMVETKNDCQKPTEARHEL